MMGRCLLILWAVMCWQSHLILLLKGRKSIAGHLIRKIEENGDCLDTGFLTTPYLLDAPVRSAGWTRHIKSCSRQSARHGFNEVKQGATTIWENYISYKEDGSPVMTSLNHYAFLDAWTTGCSGR